jgi:predicted O-methyltransferase YrrM
MNNYQQWSDVDAYFTDVLLPADDVLTAALDASKAAGLPEIAVSPPQGRMLQLLATLHGARSVLEVGTLGGYSTIWMARGVPADGRVITLEIDPKHAEVARANFVRAGLDDRIEVRLGPALESLPKLAAAGDGPFDMVFIDADKGNNPDYFAWALRLSRPGSLIVVDNVVRNGRVLDADSADVDIVGTRKLIELVAAEPTVSATAIQTVGTKGYDGFVLAIVNES